MRSRILLTTLLLFAFIAGYGMKVTITSSITTNTTWVDTNVYYLDGFIYVKNNATLTIMPGTIIRGVKANKGTLIITKNGKINAQGTSTNPIVFTSDQPAGSRSYGDWGGVIILGKAPTNSSVTVGSTTVAGVGVIEGGVNNAAGDGEYGAGASSDPNDSSGVFSYVRIEFPGVAFQVNNEINGLTLGGVGAKTKLDHIQVSYSGDDSYEWFGGTANAKYLIAYRGWDDDFDTDNGFIGNVQYGFSLRDSAIADISGSNGFESDNDATGSSTTPYTAPVFSNMTIIGPKQTSTTTVNTNFKRSMHLRRNTRTSIFNSVFMGWPTGLLLDGSACETNATSGALEINNTTIAGMSSKFAVASGSSFGLASWFSTAGFSNDTTLSFAGIALTDATSYNAPNLIPISSSPLLGSASFLNPKVANSFFNVVSYRGAFGTTDWTQGWANFNPQLTVYEPTDSPAPLMVSTTPSDNSSNVPATITNSISITFNKPVMAGAGNVVLWNLTDASSVNIAASTASISGNTASFSGISLLENKNYALNIDSTAFLDPTNGKKYAGFVDISTWNFNTNWSLGLNNIKTEKLKIVNLNDKIKVVLPAASDLNKIEVFDNFGKCIYQTSATTNSNELYINTTNYSTGTYNVVLSAKSKLYVSKFIKQ